MDQNRQNNTKHMLKGFIDQNCWCENRSVCVGWNVTWDSGSANRKRNANAKHFSHSQNLDTESTFLDPSNFWQIFGSLAFFPHKPSLFKISQACALTVTSWLIAWWFTRSAYCIYQKPSKTQQSLAFFSTNLASLTTWGTTQRVKSHVLYPFILPVFPSNKAKNILMVN